jgi:hypothetical protein
MDCDSIGWKGYWIAAPTRATPKQFSKSPRPRTLPRLATAPPPLPPSASHTPYSQREAEAGSPLKSATATPSNSVIVLTGTNQSRQVSDELSLKG